MFFLLVIPSWVAAFLGFRRIFEDWREAALGASVTWGVSVVILTEGLSTFHALAFLPLLIAWGIISCATIVISIYFYRADSISGIPIVNPLRRKYFFASLLLAGICSILFATFVVALLSPPNSWDSMTYHMARVLNWIDHSSVRCYPTNNPRQLYLGPWAEFTITHLQILAGNDRLANLVQFVSTTGSVVGVSLIAKKFRAGMYGQLFASVYCASIPVGILEASGTLNDDVTAFWLLCFLAFTIDIVEATTPVSWRNATLAGASLGLAILTKMTNLIFAAPFLLWIVLVLLRSRKVIAISLLGILGGSALAINAGQAIRNASAFGSPLGPQAETALSKNEIHTPAAISSNVIRNLAVHLALPKVGRYIKPMVLKIHSLTGLDTSDPRITWKGATFQYQITFSEYFAGSPLHLLVASIVILVVCFYLPEYRLVAIYTACLIGGFLMFCGYVRWQPWISRLQLPLFVAVAPVCGLVLSRPTFRRFGYIFSAVAICVGLLYATKNDSRALLGRPNVIQCSRVDLYFSDRPAIRGPFLAAAAETARGSPATVGIIAGWDDWEYPFRLFVRSESKTHTQFEHLDVKNESRDCPPEVPSKYILPDKIVVIGSYTPESLPPGYKPAFVSEPIRVFERVHP